MTLKNKIKKIIDAIKDTDINEVSISSFWGFQKIKLSKNTSGKIDSSINPVKSKSNENQFKDEDLDVSNEISSSDDDENSDILIENSDKDDIIQNLTVIESPLVGTCYESSKPGDPPFVNIGDKISKGKTLCIVEAMKIFNEIESEYNGVVVEILIKNGEPVEYGQPLFKIKEN